MKAYKATDSDLTCRGFKYEIGKTYKTDGVLEVYDNGFHACLKMEDVFNHYNITSRVFEVELSGKIEVEDNNVCGEEITFIRELSQDEIVANIEYNEYKYLYCYYIKDREELWSTIEDNQYKYLYCKYVQERKEVWSTITDDYWKYRYCKNIRDRKEIWSTIKSCNYKYKYRRNVKDRKELR